MTIEVHFYSYFKELTGSTVITQDLAGPRPTMNDLLHQVCLRFPKLGAMHNSILAAVDVEYQGRSYLLKEGDVVSLFPPVQGG